MKQSSVAAGWDDDVNAARYDRFWDDHPRYRRATHDLVERLVEAAPDARAVLDVAAGTGRTAARLAERLRPPTTITCFEPAAAMRRRGEARLPRARWVSAWPPAAFDAIVCACASWQLPLAATFARAAAALVAGGTLVFDVPALYLGIPDEPGGGRDPMLVEGVAQLARRASMPASRASTLASPPSTPNQPFLGGVAGVEATLATAGFTVEVFGTRRRLGCHELRDWLALPVISAGVVPGGDADERAQAVHRAFADADPSSWRWEGWRLFRATKR